MKTIKIDIRSSGFFNNYSLGFQPKRSKTLIESNWIGLDNRARGKFKYLYLIKANTWKCWCNWNNNCNNVGHDWMKLCKKSEYKHMGRFPLLQPPVYHLQKWGHALLWGEAGPEQLANDTLFHPLFLCKVRETPPLKFFCIIIRLSKDVLFNCEGFDSNSLSYFKAKR